ncbi:hypothetical protein MUG94_04015 [Arthrobacter gengyunqii]|uniref:Uncharacterized protein n=1 Tax=Arthrobacter gengyunqii TaxID=2886940 RepID=A0A9X1M648_9MICC|nr:hypothetical protein [Arthrobacter gengyunqii]MCC3270250.1 hypothetical protein [Arthrobacter gengyunqii]MCC3271039.1 hypothetical protein [Arthrobacter gengyunqii]UOY96955.1 hypothetical protein MUG94_04015 [Arthrobacter gengyunqii]
MDNSVDTADRQTAGRFADADNHRRVAEPRGVSLQDYRVITAARREFLDFLLARTEHRT